MITRNRCFRVVFIIFGGLLAVFLSACSGQPAISVAASELALGDVPNGTIIERDVVVTNTGRADLVIEAVTTSCGCTEASMSSSTIAPGGEATLHVVFDSGAHGPELTGQLTRQIFIAANDPEHSETVIQLSANILPPVAP